MERLFGIILIGLFAIADVHAGQKAPVDSLFQAAMATLDRDDRDASVKAFKQVLRADARYAPANAELAKLYLAEDTPNSRRMAEKAIRQAIFLDPNNPSYQLFLGDVMLFRGFRYEAGQHYDAVLAKFPNAPEVAFRAGHNAVREFMLTKDRRIPGMEVFMQKAWERAVLLLEKCIELDPTYRDAYYQLGLVHLEYNNPVGLVQVMSRLLKRFPDDKDGLMFLGLAYQARGQFDRADKLYGAALAQMTPDERAMMENVDLIASKEDSTARALADSSTEAWVNSPDYRRFWVQRDPLLLTDANERRLEHYGRVAYANLRFSLPSRGEEGWLTVPGKTYIKFGRYLHRTISTVPIFTEVWYYEGFMFTFRSVNGLDKWRFAGDVGPSSAPDVLGDAGVGIRNPTASAFDDGGDQTADRWFQKPVTHLYLDQKYGISETMSWKRDREAFEQEPPRFIDPFSKQKYSLPHLTAAFRQGDSMRVELAYAIPVSKLKRSEAGVSLDDGLFLFDDQWNSAYREVNRLTQANASLPDTVTGYLLRSRTVWVKPGDYFMVSEVGDRQGGSIGTFREERRLAVADSGLAMSDLLLAGRIRALKSFPERREDLAVTPNPTRTFSHGKSAFVYLELYNLAQNDYGRTRYDIAYRIGVPDKDEVDPALFGAVGLKASGGRLLVVTHESAAENGEDSTAAVSAPSAPSFDVHYVLAERNRLSEKLDQLLQSGRQNETAISSEYAGNEPNDFTYLEISLAGLPPGIYKLTVTATDVTTKQAVDRSTLFRVID